MSTSDWIALAALLVAIIGTASATFYARRSAKTAEGAAESARKSAAEAAALTAIEADRRVEEKEAAHDRQGPVPPAEIELEFKPNRNVGGGHGSLFATITAPRGYRVQAQAVYDNGTRTGTGLGTTVKPNQPEEFFVEHWHPDQTEPKTKELWIRFWPPLEPDGLDVWTCPCGRPTGESLGGASGNDPGHWEWRVPVVFYRPRVRTIE